MDDLIEALKILRKYDNPKWPTHCEHDKLHVAINPDIVSEEDKERLDELGFFPDDEWGGGFMSYKFGSC